MPLSPGGGCRRRRGLDTGGPLPRRQAALLARANCQEVMVCPPPPPLLVWPVVCHTPTPKLTQAAAEPAIGSAPAEPDTGSTDN